MAGDNVSLSNGHHAPDTIVLCSRTCVPLLGSHSLDAVIWLFGIGTGPFTNGISEGHVGANKTKTINVLIRIKIITLLELNSTL